MNSLYNMKHAFLLLLLALIGLSATTVAWSSTGGASRRSGFTAKTALTPRHHCQVNSFGPAVPVKSYSLYSRRGTKLHVQATIDDAPAASVLVAEQTTSSSSPQLQTTTTMTEPDWKQAFLPNDDHEKLKERIINGIFLAVSFGYVLYTILNIDHGMTRGWTHEEMLLRIPVDNWNNYETSLAEKPIFTKTLINVIIYLLGDWLSQTVFQKKNVLDFDIMRTLRNGFIGLCFGPLVHQYYEWSDYILPVEGGFWNRAEKILMDQTIYLVVKCSIYISAVGLLKGDSWEDVKQNVQDRIVGIVFTAWKFWPLVHCITYGLIPARHRILWVNSVDLIWNAILASKAQRQEEPEELQQPPVAMEAAVDERLMEITFIDHAESVPTLIREDQPQHSTVQDDHATLSSTNVMEYQKLISSTLEQHPPKNGFGDNNVQIEADSIALSLSRNITFAAAVAE